MRQQFFHRKLVSGKSHWLHIRDIHARSTGLPRKNRACSSLCYLSPSFLTLSTRGLAPGETNSLSTWEWQWDCLISLWASSLYQVWYWHDSLSGNYPVTYENKASFPCLTYSSGKKTSIESVWMYLMQGFAMPRASLYHESSGSSIRKLYYSFSTPGKWDLFNEINLDFWILFKYFMIFLRTEFLN